MLDQNIAITDQAKCADAEANFREALAIQRKLSTNESLRLTIVNLAGLLQAQAKHGETESLLLDAYDMFRNSNQPPFDANLSIMQALRQLYITWGAVAPGTGKVQKGMEWGAKLTEFETFAKAQKRLLSKIPLRNPDANVNLVRLDKYYNCSFNENWHGTSPDNNLKKLPTGSQTFAGTQFDVRGLIQVRAQSRSFPSNILDIAVGMSCQRLQFLHAAIDAFRIADGTRIGRYVIHFADGKITEVPLVLGDNILDWFAQPNESKKPMIAWTGDNEKSKREKSRIRLFKTTWVNPSPGTPVRSIDFLAEHTKASPFLVAITAEE